MRRLTKTLATLALAGGTAVGALTAAGPAAAGGGGGLVNVYAQDILSGNQVVLLQNVPIDVAANVCGVAAAVLSDQLASGDKATCTNKNTNLIKSWVAYA